MDRRCPPVTPVREAPFKPCWLHFDDPSRWEFIAEDCAHVAQPVDARIELLVRMSDRQPVEVRIWDTVSPVSEGALRTMAEAPKDAPILLLCDDGVIHHAEFSGPSDGAIYSGKPSGYNWFSRSAGHTLHDSELRGWFALPHVGSQAGRGRSVVSDDRPFPFGGGTRDKPQPWEPEPDNLRRAVLGKLAEETGECTAIAARCLIQGLDACEPVTGKPNREALEDEIADVIALTRAAGVRLGLDVRRITDRAERKVAFTGKWFDRFNAKPAAPTADGERTDADWLFP